jgi:integrase
MRREEFCGLLVDEIMPVAETGERIAHVKVWDNEIRRLKNAQSRRFLPLHPELLRLGIIEYADRIKATGYKLLFPELRSPSSRSPLGDRYYDEWSKAKLVGITAHPLRHAFNDELKQKRVSDEMRADMMGHGGKSETTERYANAFQLKAIAKDMKKIPVLTAAIAAQPVNIIPWVAAKQHAPWARKSRKTTE